MHFLSKMEMIKISATWLMFNLGQKILFNCLFVFLIIKYVLKKDNKM